MDKLFISILNMSLTGAFVIMVICLARLPLKKAPKIISYCLWAVAGFRLVFPFSIESFISLVPFKTQPIPQDIALQAVPRINSGITVIDNAVSASLPAATPFASINPLQVWMAIGAYVWLVGAVIMLLYGVVSYILLKRKMRIAIRVEENIYETDTIQSPFVLGIIKPKIYIPLGLSDGERKYIMLHELTHIRRHDHIVKFAAYFILCLHWFNPLTWLAFLLMGVDMEMSCDERVLKDMGEETKNDYSLSLLSLAATRRVLGGSPLAFSEGSLKQRIKNVLNFKKPSQVVITLAVVLVAVLGAGFAVNRVGEQPYSIAYSIGTGQLEKAHPETMGRESVSEEIVALLTDMYSGSEYLYIQDGVFTNEKSTITYPSVLVGDEIFNQLLSLLNQYEWRANRALSSFSASDFGLFIEIYTPDMVQVITLYGGYDLFLYKDNVSGIPMYYTYIPPEDMVSADLAERIKDSIYNEWSTKITQ